MILKGSQRGGALKLAAHLMRLDENDHVEVHELRGFSADDLRGALQEADAVAKGTRCRQFLFSLSFNPPATERVTTEEFEAAIDKAEAKLGLQDQARAIIFHEKEGRRHAHVVWSRIDVGKMTAINLPFYKTKLKDIAKELFLEHGWRLPDGFRNRQSRNPLNFTLAEWQQAKRTKQDAQALKIMFRECWSVSDSRPALQRALEDQGFLLARGDRRGFVAIDWRGETYSLSRWTGEKTKTLKDKLGDPKDLADVAAVKEQIVSRMTEKLHAFIREAEAGFDTKAQDVLARKLVLRGEQRTARQNLLERHASRADQEALFRAARFRRGLGGVWDWLSGRTRKIREQNELEAAEAARRDAGEREKLIATQLSQRRALQHDLRSLRREGSKGTYQLRRDVAFYLGVRRNPTDDGTDSPALKPQRKLVGPALSR